MTLSEFLYQKRREVAQTQAEYADYLGISSVTLNHIETKTRKPGSNVLKIISKKLDIDIREVVKMNDRDYE